MKLLYIFCVAITPWALLSMDNNLNSSAYYIDAGYTSEEESDSIVLSAETSKIPKENEKFQAYLGTFPNGTNIIINSLLAYQKKSMSSLSSQSKKQPIPQLIKIVGPRNIGKTTLIRTISRQTKSEFYEINQKADIKKVIENFYDPENKPKIHIIAITNKSKLKNVKALKDYLLKNQKPSAPLVVIIESNELGPDDSCNYDEIIQVKLYDSNIRAIFANVLKESRWEARNWLKDPTIQKLSGCLPDEIKNIANRAIRIASSKKAPHVTNEHVIEALATQVIRSELSFPEQDSSESD